MYERKVKKANLLRSYHVRYNIKLCSPDTNDTVKLRGMQRTTVV